MKKGVNLIVEINRQCNANCIYCPVPKDKRYLKVERFKALLEEHAPIKYLGLSGGEPFLHPHVDEILRVGRDIVKDGMVVIASNLAVAIDNNMLKTLKDNRIIVQISLPTLDAELYEKIMGLPRRYGIKALYNVKALDDAEVPFAVNVVLTKLNADMKGMEQIVKLCLAHKHCLGVRFHPMIAVREEHAEIAPPLDWEERLLLLQAMYGEIVNFPSKEGLREFITEGDGELYITEDLAVEKSLFHAYAK